MGQVRIADFYLLFPFRLNEVHFKRKDQRFRKLAEAYQSRRGYAIQPPPLELFASMQPVFDAAAQTLTSQDFFIEAELLAGCLSPSARKLPASINERVVTDNERERDLLDCIRTLLGYEFLGPDGLKARTGLMVFRNDAP